MKATIYFMKSKFREFNERFFNNSLPTPIFELMNRKKALGDFTSLRGLEYNFGSYMRIRLNKAFERSENDLETTLLHEMIHQYIYVHNIRDNGAHGRKFLQIAEKIKENSNGIYNITALAQLDDNMLVTTKDKKRIVVIFDNNKFSVVSKDSLIGFISCLLRNKTLFHIYESDLIYFKQFKTCHRRITYYMITETNKELFEKQIIPNSKNITENVFMKIEQKAKRG